VLLHTASFGTNHVGEVEAAAMTVPEPHALGQKATKAAFAIAQHIWQYGGRHAHVSALICTHLQVAVLLHQQRVRLCGHSPCLVAEQLHLNSNHVALDCDAGVIGPARAHGHMDTCFAVLSTG
jgi:hypothetical protein